MSDPLKSMLEAFRAGNEEEAAKHLNEYVAQKVVSLNENLGNVITRAIPGAPDGGAVIPNVYTTKSIPKKKKKLPSLKKGRYGTGYAPLGCLSGDCSGAGGDSDAGGDAGSGGDGGGGGE